MKVATKTFGPVATAKLPVASGIGVATKTFGLVTTGSPRVTTKTFGLVVTGALPVARTFGLVATGRLLGVKAFAVAAKTSGLVAANDVSICSSVPRSTHPGCSYTCSSLVLVLVLLPVHVSRFSFS